MEAVYPPAKFICTEKLRNLSEHFDDFSKDCYHSERRAFTGEESMEDTLLKLYGDAFSSEKLAEWSENCSIDRLTVPYEYKPIDVLSCSKYTIRLFKPIPKTARSLNTVQAKIDWDRRCKAKPRDTDNISLTNDFSKTIDFTPGSELLISVRVHHPYAFVPKERVLSDYRFDEFKCSHEVVALGSQTLKELRDKFLCASDAGPSTEVDDIFEPAPLDVKDDFSSSLICLDNMLYVDMPREDSVDYSVVLKRWAKEKEFKEAFVTEDMRDVKLGELNFRLGYPYVFQHRGNCEHIFVFSDVRLARRTDSLCRGDYPFYANVNRYNMQHCGFCRKLVAQWLCLGGDRLVHDQTFLCHECMVSYNYVDGQKIGNFKAYPYNNKSLIC